MKVAILNDTHCGIRNSSEIFMEYQSRFYTDVFFPYLKEHNIKKILHLGDYYENRTSINFKALHHNRRIFLDKLRDNSIHMDIIPGNHDCYFKNTNRLNALKELLGRGRAKKGMFEGDLNEGELEIGQISGLIHSIQPAADIVHEILEEFRIAKSEQSTEKFNF